MCVIGVDVVPSFHYVQFVEKVPYFLTLVLSVTDSGSVLSLKCCGRHDETDKCQKSEEVVV